MGDRATTTITIRTSDFKRIFTPQFEADHYVNQVETIDALTHLTQDECNYAEWESLQNLLAEKNIEYDKDWGPGSEYSAGCAHARLVKGKMRIVEFYEADKGLLRFLDDLKKISDPNKLKQAVDAEYKRQYPFEITPLNRPVSVKAILELSKTKKKRSKYVRRT